MITQTVEFVTTRRTAIESRVPDQFQLRPDRGWLWVQKVAFWLLRKLKCYAIRTDHTIQRYRVDYKTLLEAINAQQGELATFYFLRGERLLVGPEVFRDLMELNRPMSFSVPCQITMQGKMTAFGMEVTVIPWMKGMLVLPKEPK